MDLVHHHSFPFLGTYTLLLDPFLSHFHFHYWFQQRPEIGDNNSMDRLMSSDFPRKFELRHEHFVERSLVALWSGMNTANEVGEPL
jgi:hypothetical protein